MEPKSLRPTIMRAAFGFAFVLCVSCASSPKIVAAPNPPNGSESALLQASLGSKPEMSFFVRPKLARTDRYWGPMLERAIKKKDSGSDPISRSSMSMLLDAQQIDFHIAIRDPIALQSKSKSDPSAIGWVGVFFGLSIDPLALRDGSNRPLFLPGERLPSGVMSYAPTETQVQALGALVPSLFVAKDGTCVVADRQSAQQMRGVLGTTGEPPAPLEATADALAGITFGVTSMRFFDKHDNATLQGMVRAGYGLRGGRNGAIEGYADYASSDDASRAFSAFQKTCVENPKECVFEQSLFRDARAERDGTRILMTLAFAQPLLESLQSY